MTNKKTKQDAVVIYEPKKGVAVTVQVGKDTVWLDSRQMADIFGTQRPAIVKHVNNIYKTKELSERATCSILEQVAKDGKMRKVNLYNLDMIISVGYRVNSKKATNFRTWATTVLKKYLLDGYAINERRIQEAQQKFLDLQNVVQLLSAKVSAENLRGQEQELFALLNDYAKTLTVLEQYDKSILINPKATHGSFVLTYEETRTVLDDVRAQLIEKGEATDLFARERGGEFEGIIRGLYQSFGGKELYKGVEQKAAHLLYFVIKDHPFSDGNKRSASFLFVYFLSKNNALFKSNGERKINDNALTALALLVAESDPKEKETMVELIANLITG
jgi:hypothetical protein